MDMHVHDDIDNMNNDSLMNMIQISISCRVTHEAGGRKLAGSDSEAARTQAPGVRRGHL